MLGESNGLSFAAPLLKAFDRERLGHGLLLSYPASRYPEFLREKIVLVKSLLCMQREEGKASCNECDSCRMIGENPLERAHPDLTWMRPESPVSGYGVDQVRALLQAASLRKSLSPNRVICVEEAELLSAGQGAAANALLKLLEEPRPDTYLLLSSSKAQGVLPTLKSRCQIFRLWGDDESANEAPDGWHEVRTWLERGAPERARISSPADEDAFWKERDKALLELETVGRSFWSTLKPHWSRWKREEALRVWDFFTKLEECARAVRGYGHGALQWAAFKAQLKVS